MAGSYIIPDPRNGAYTHSNPLPRSQTPDRSDPSHQSDRSGPYKPGPRPKPQEATMDPLISAIGAMLAVGVLYGGKMLWDKITGKKDRPDKDK